MRSKEKMRSEGRKCPKLDLGPKNTQKSKISKLGHFDISGISRKFRSQIFLKFSILTHFGHVLGTFSKIMVKNFLTGEKMGGKKMCFPKISKKMRKKMRKNAEKCANSRKTKKCAKNAEK